MHIHQPYNLTHQLAQDPQDAATASSSRRYSAGLTLTKSWSGEPIPPGTFTLNPAPSSSIVSPQSPPLARSQNAPNCLQRIFDLLDLSRMPMHAVQQMANHQYIIPAHYKADMDDCINLFLSLNNIHDSSICTIFKQEVWQKLFMEYHDIKQLKPIIEEMRQYVNAALQNINFNQSFLKSNEEEYIKKINNISIDFSKKINDTLITGAPFNNLNDGFSLCRMPDGIIPMIHGLPLVRHKNYADGVGIYVYQYKIIADEYGIKITLPQFNILSKDHIHDIKNILKNTHNTYKKIILHAPIKCALSYLYNIYNEKTSLLLPERIFYRYLMRDNEVSLKVLLSA